MKWWMERAEIVKQWCFACHCHIPRTDVSCVKWDSKCWQMLMFPWSGLNRFRIKATLDFISPHHPAIMFTVSSHSLAFHTSKDITWLWDINLCAVELWPVFLLHNMKHKWTHSSHGNNYISQSPKVAGDLYPVKAFALKKRTSIIFCIPLGLLLGWWSRSVHSIHGWGGWFAYIHFLSPLGF